MSAIIYGVGHVHMARFQQKQVEGGLSILLPGHHSGPQLQDAGAPDWHYMMKRKGIGVW